jgi:hypothetical protein
MKTAIDFAALMARDETFVASASNWNAYLAWSRAQVCVGCGAKASERTPEKPWVTEVECMACWSARIPHA